MYKLRSITNERLIINKYFYVFIFYLLFKFSTCVNFFTYYSFVTINEKKKKRTIYTNLYVISAFLIAILRNFAKF